MDSSARSAFDFDATTIDGAARSLRDYAGQVLLIVNVASQCGLTPQYAGLEQLWRTYRERGFTVLGFPCNQFGAQEPGTEAQIATFCETRFDVTFPLFAKIDVNGDGAHPLWKWMRQEEPGLLGSEAIKWNFTKFLIGRDGRVLQRFAPTSTPESLVSAIEAALAQPA
ncbi:MAG: glutathione peroxidase [Gemmatimonadaceae bacterium]|nr:glutathione peroxidase [Gemmatimonadaceae bacterium]